MVKFFPSLPLREHNVRDRFRGANWSRDASSARMSTTSIVHRSCLCTSRAKLTHTYISRVPISPPKESSDRDEHAKKRGSKILQIARYGNYRSKQFRQLPDDFSDNLYTNRFKNHIEINNDALQ